MPVGYRIFKSRRRPTAFSGEGSRLNGGRWNRVGTAVVYLSDSLALAALEVLVNTTGRKLLGYSYAAVSIPDNMIARVGEGELPAGWSAAEPLEATQDLGSAWFASASSVALRVPSAVIPIESNILLNPDHPDFVRLTIGPVTPFRFDPRLR